MTLIDIFLLTLSAVCFGFAWHFRRLAIRARSQYESLWSNCQGLRPPGPSQLVTYIAGLALGALLYRLIHRRFGDGES